MSDQIIRARDVMQKEVLSIDGMASAKEAAAKMRVSRAPELLVARRNDDDAWGIVTIMDLVKLLRRRFTFKNESIRYSNTRRTGSNRQSSGR